MSSIQTSVQELNRLVEDRQILPAFDRFYADDVVMVDAGQEPMIGKDANRARETMFADGLTKWDCRLVSSSVDEQNGVAFNQWEMSFSHDAWGDATYKQVAVQQWRDGRIVHEAFYKL